MTTPLRTYSLRVVSVVVPFLAAACAAAARPAPSPGSTARGCTFVRVEHSDTEADVDSDSVFVTLVYTPPGKDVEPVSTKIQVRRERVGDLEAHLQARPDLVCEPDREAPGGYRVESPTPDSP